MSGTLYVVATPIGNLEDITLRALRVLREADLIAAEDTRRTARLLAHYGIVTSTVSFHEHNARSRTPQLLARLESGQSIALVTDAGTPAVSDPGADLVASCIETHIPVEPIPGASAWLAALTASGFIGDSVLMSGFPPQRSSDRKLWLADRKAFEGIVIFFEAPHRIRSTLAEAADVFGQRPVVVGRELTKLHQEFIRGTISSVLAQLENPRGEFTVVIGPPIRTGSSRADLPSNEELAKEFGEMANSAGISRRDAVTALARKYGRPSREMYAALEKAKVSGR